MALGLLTVGRSRRDRALRSQNHRRSSLAGDLRPEAPLAVERIIRGRGDAVSEVSPPAESPCCVAGIELRDSTCC
jgi:hypothetical protein